MTRLTDRSMQERELSRRTLHFLPNEVIWHCSGLTDCECGVPLEYQHKLMALSTILSTDMGAQGSEKGTFAFGQAWAKIVEEYASLDITNLSDTLPALSGLAKRIQSSVSGQYFAGMWATDIAFLLSWSLRIESVDDNSKYGYKKSVPKQRRSVPGPTFSWVTSPGLVTWPTDTAVVSNCVLESVQCVPETVNPYGHLRTCSLQIQARVLNIADFTRLVDDAIANWVHRESKYKMVKIHLDAQAFEAPRWYKENINQFWKDARSDWSDIICVELYHIAEPDEGYGNGVQALLLYAENPGVYKRIGTVSYAITEWFQKDGKVETITII